MTPHQSELLGCLKCREPTPIAKAILKRTLEQFVLEHGWWYEPAELSKQIVGTPNECHSNATNMMLSNESLIYCEGFALFQSASRPTIHAWVTDGNGRVIDNTWPHPGVAYAGVPFKSSFVTVRALKHRAVISLLDDWQNGYPLMGTFGDCPEEWFEPKGKGIERISEPTSK